MEIKETAACGISEREFAIDLDDSETAVFQRTVNSALEANHLETDLGKKILQSIAEPESDEGIPLNETEIVKLYKSLKAAVDGGMDCDPDFADDFFEFCEQIVGSALEE